MRGRRCAAKTDYRTIACFFLRLETASGECFVGVTEVSNNFELRLEIWNSERGLGVTAGLVLWETTAGCVAGAGIGIVLLAPARFVLGRLPESYLIVKD
jgi:hypothetical protein